MAVATSTVSKADVSLAVTKTSADSNLAGTSVTNAITVLRNFLNLSVTGGKVWYIYATVTSGSNVEYDLTNLTDASGLAVAFSSVNALLLINKNLTAGKKIKMPASGATNPWITFLDASASIELDGGGALLLCNPNTSYAVNGTNKTLRITQSAGAANCDFELYIIGQ